MKNPLIKDYLNNSFGISPRLFDAVSRAEESLGADFENVDGISEYHQARILKAFQECNVSDNHFAWNTGYGYDDLGRETVEKVFAKVFDAEAALVRPNIVNGTHAIALALLGVLRAGDKLIYCTGTPYDTLQSVIGYHSNTGENTGTLKDLGVHYEEIPLLNKGEIDIDALKSKLDDRVKIVAIQRSKGYSLRNSITVDQIEETVKAVHEINDKIIVMVDNCYSEFVGYRNPIEAGADIICGSLIKNPGGGLALSGGYICGKEELIDLISNRLTCPGIGGECGLTFGQNRNVLQGLFQAAKVTAGALKGAMLCGKAFEDLGFEVSPTSAENSIRSDIIQAIRFNDPELVKKFCEGIQMAAPIDSNVTPVPAPMPGYEDDVIMAAGTFIQGSSIELSADGPLREPYAVYFQGGLTYQHSKLGVLISSQKMIDAGMISL